MDLNLSETEIHIQTDWVERERDPWDRIGNKDLRSDDAQGTFLGINSWTL